MSGEVGLIGNTHGMYEFQLPNLSLTGAGSVLVRDHFKLFARSLCLCFTTHVPF